MHHSFLPFFFVVAHQPNNCVLNNMETFHVTCCLHVALCLSIWVDLRTSGKLCLIIIANFNYFQPKNNEKSDLDLQNACESAMVIFF